MLNIHLQRNLPDALKPKKIAIKDYSGAVHEAVDTDSK
jgi:hypothetical protein